MKSSSPGWDVVLAALIGSSVGLSTAAGIHHLSSEPKRYDWIGDFLFALALCLYVAALALRAHRTFRNSARADKDPSEEHTDQLTPNLTGHKPVS